MNTTLSCPTRLRGGRAGQFERRACRPGGPGAGSSRLTARASRPGASRRLALRARPPQPERRLAAAARRAASARRSRSAVSSRSSSAAAWRRVSSTASSVAPYFCRSRKSRSRRRSTSASRAGSSCTSSAYSRREPGQLGRDWRSAGRAARARWRGRDRSAPAHPAAGRPGPAAGSAPPSSPSISAREARAPARPGCRRDSAGGPRRRAPRPRPGWSLARSISWTTWRR